MHRGGVRGNENGVVQLGFIFVLMGKNVHFLHFGVCYFGRIFKIHNLLDIRFFLMKQLHRKELQLGSNWFSVVCEADFNFGGDRYVHKYEEGKQPIYWS
jgi:hypothetical protein